MEWLTLLNTCLTIVLTSVCGYTTWYLQKRFNDKSVTAEALKIILRKQLRELYNEAAQKSYTTYEELEEYNSLYEIYHDKLGGNGTGTKLHDDYLKLEVKED